jgi:DNA-binding CsgD family transcriptional regulator
LVIPLPQLQVSKLTESQKQCLRLVHEGYEAKEIARNLLISPSAVVERLRAARRSLGAQTSREAARMLALNEQSTPYNRIVYNPIGVEPAHQSVSILSSLTSQAGDGFNAFTDQELLEKPVSTDPVGSRQFRHFPLPFPTAGRQDNDLTVLQTIAMIIGLSVGLSAVSIAALSIVGELANLRLK